MNIKERFKTAYGLEPELVVRAPGRVNLIGEHTDYNEGFVLPAAINRAMSIAARRTHNGRVRVRSLEFDEEDSFPLSSIAKTELTWSNYLRGVLSTLSQLGHELSGFDAVLSGDVPIGAGLSSSAAFEVAVAALVNDISQLRLSGAELAKISQRCENDFVGVNCGIMDQFISALGQQDSALLIDCRSLEYRAVKLNLDEQRVSLVITNSGVSRGLVDSEYNARRRQCEQGVKLLGALLNHDIHSLRDVTSSEYAALQERLPDLVARRCRHVISENERVLAAVSALESGNLTRFGQLMNDSHASLKDDYEVSCYELDCLVELTQAHKGTYGARMTGAGFGGCTVALISRNGLAEFIDEVVPKYERLTRKKAAVYVCQAVSGVSVERSAVEP